MTSNKPLTNRQKQAIRTKQHIFETAKKLFSENSFEKVTVDQIITACNIGKGTFYHYYPSKDALLDSIERVPYQSINDTVAASEAPAWERLHEYIILWFSLMDQDDVGYTGHWLKHAVDPDKAPSPVQNDTKMDFDMQMIRQIYLDGIDNKELQPETPVEMLVSEIHFSMVGSAVYRCERKGDFDVMKWAETFASMSIEKFIDPYRVTNS